MVAFLKLMDNKTRKTYIKIWNPLKTTTKYNNIIVKAEKDWTTDEAIRSSRALKVVYNRTDKNIFIIINTCTSAKEALETLEVAYEGKSKICMSRY